MSAYTTYKNGGMKDERGKPDYTLLPWNAVDEVVKALAYGADKYARDNWRLVPGHEYIKSTLRHVVALSRGEDLDRESGLPHASHAVCCLLFLLDKGVFGDALKATCHPDDKQLLLDFEDDDPFSDDDEDDDIYGGDAWDDPLDITGEDDEDALYIGSCV